ncbi:MAG: hypothetical protein GF364_22065 [Candidatus Lokiarchaeota archaeon]|nr:hypothetical protein [Candidatus Lokiarchaeota archaeon]
MKKFNIGIALNHSWFFSKEFGNSLGIVEAEPKTVFNKACEITNNICNGFQKTYAHNEIDLNGLIQLGQESMIFYTDPEIYEYISAIPKMTRSKDYQIFPYIHVQNNAWPEMDDFIDKIKPNFKRALDFKDKAVCVHLNVADKDNTNNILQKTILGLTRPQYIRLIEKYKRIICYENNHHQSYFGYPENIVNLYEKLDKKLIELGKEHLIRYYSFCFDVGHLMSQLFKAKRNIRINFKKFYEIFGDRIQTFHLHTNSGAWDDHIIPLPYKELIKKDPLKYNPQTTDKHTRALWDTLKTWKKVTEHSEKERWFIFELDIPYTPQQAYEIGQKLGESLS